MLVLSSKSQTDRKCHPAKFSVKETQMNLKVLTLTGGEHELDIEPEDKVARIKEKLEEIEGVPPSQQRLIYQGKKLRDDDTVAKSKIHGGATIHLVVALRGGETHLRKGGRRLRGLGSTNSAATRLNP